MMDSLPVPYAAARTRTALATSALLLSMTITVLPMQGCRLAPISGRRQLVLIPEAEEIQLGGQAYEEMLAAKPLPPFEADRAIDGMRVCVETLRTQAGTEIPMGLNAASTGRFAMTQSSPATTSVTST